MGGPFCNISTWNYSDGAVEDTMEMESRTQRPKPSFRYPLSAMPSLSWDSALIQVEPYFLYQYRLIHSGQATDALTCIVR